MLEEIGEESAGQISKDTLFQANIEALETEISTDILSRIEAELVTVGEDDTPSLLHELKLKINDSIAKSKASREVISSFVSEFDSNCDEMLSESDRQKFTKEYLSISDSWLHESIQKAMQTGVKIGLKSADVPPLNEDVLFLEHVKNEAYNLMKIKESEIEELVKDQISLMEKQNEVLENEDTPDQFATSSMISTEDIVNFMLQNNYEEGKVSSTSANINRSDTPIEFSTLLSKILNNLDDSKST